ncbi:MAG: radical SAM protein [Candidatus Omnitrophota bacterium]
MDNLNIEKKINTLSYCDLGISYRCNYKCRMCNFWENNPINDDNALNNEEWKDVLRQLKELPTSDDFMINFAGAGEALLRQGVVPLIAYGRALDLKMHLISNGAFVTEDVAKKIAQAGLEYMSFSLDSMNKHTHDFLRGVCGAHEKVVRAVYNTARFSPRTKIGINTVISKVNMHEIVELVEWVQSNEHIGYINFQTVTQPFSFIEPPDPEWFSSDKYRFLWPDNPGLIDKTMDALIKLKQKGYKIADEVSQFDIFREYFLNPLVFIKQNRCNMGQGKVLIIDPVGNVSMCPMIGIIDSLKDKKSLLEILSSKEVCEHKKMINDCRRNCHLIVSCYFQDEEESKLCGD